MDSFSTYFPGIIRKFADSINLTKPSNDTIKFYRFQKIPLKDSTLHLCLLIGYELGFDIWSMSPEPELIFSKRNQGISLITYLPPSHPPQFALASLYQTSDFPLNSFILYSPESNSILKQVLTEKPVKDLQSNTLVLVASTSTKLLIYERVNYNLVNQISIDSQELTFSLSNLYIAYTLTPRSQEACNETDIKIQDMISKTVQSFAESGLNKIKNYIDPSQIVQYQGRIWVKNLMTSAAVCEIQAFSSAISMLQFSSTSHLLVAALASGTTFHVYRMNPSKEIKGEYKFRYFLLYKLHRGITPADIFDISISENDSFITVSSCRGTCHVFKINPFAEALVYNQEVFCRVKLGSMLDSTVQARCQIVKSNAVNEYSAKVSSNYEILALDANGNLFRYSVESEPSKIAVSSIGRGKDFREVQFSVPLLPAGKKNRSFNLRRECGNKQMTPLLASSQFVFLKTEDKYVECLDREIEVKGGDYEAVGCTLTVHYENAVRLQEALNRNIIETDGDFEKEDRRKEVGDDRIPTYQLYLAEHFYK